MSLACLFLPALPAPPGLPALVGLPAVLWAQARPRGLLFSPKDLGLLEAPDRVQWQKPDLIMDELSVADGSRVADLGAGGGWFTLRLARRVGPNGVVYAEDIQPEMIELLRRRVQNERLSNVVPILGTAMNARLPGGLDAALLVGTYPEVEDPVTLLRNVAVSLKPQGRIGIVDFTPGGGGPGPDPDQRVEPEAVINAAAAAGLTLMGRQDVPPFQFLLIFGKSGARRE